MNPNLPPIPFHFWLGLAATAAGLLNAWYARDWQADFLAWTVALYPTMCVLDYWRALKLPVPDALSRLSAFVRGWLG